MRIIVTGGAGFIGAHLVEMLIGKGHRVEVLDDFSTGKINYASKQVSFYRVNIANRIRTSEIFRRIASDDSKVDCIIHLAAKASIVPSIKNPSLYHDINVGGTVNLLEMARKYGIRKFVYAASGSCYGIPKEIPTTENCPIDPQYPYALTKYLGEQYIVSWAKYYGLEFVSLRLFNVFGPRMCLSGGYGGLFSTILAQKFNNQPVIIIGDGEQRRDFVYVADVARAFLAAAESDVKNEIFNVGMGESVSINQILDLLGIDRKDVSRLPDRPGEPRNTQACIDRIAHKLKWRREVEFLDGLSLMVADEDYWRNGRVYTWEESIRAQEDWYHYLGSRKH